MELDKVLSFLSEYAECPYCGSKYVGKESGSLEVTATRIRRTCNCGWSVELKESKA